MNNFLVSFNVVFPIFLLMAVGYIIRHINIIDALSVKKMNAVIFKLFLPMMIFKNVYESSIEDVFNKKLIVFSVVGVLAVIAALYIIVPVFEKDNLKRGVLIQAIFRSNFVIFGVPVTEALCGTGVTGSASVLIAIVVPLFNFFAVVTLEVFGGGKPDFKKIVKGIISNPLIISSVLGLLALFSGIRFPDVIETSIADIAKITTPLALIMLGASINFGAVGSNKWRLIIGVCSKLIIIPSILLPLAVFAFGFSGSELAILLAVFATPPAVSSFTMAQQMNADSDLAGLLVMFGTVACLVTMFMWIFVIKQAGLI